MVSQPEDKDPHDHITTKLNSNKIEGVSLITLERNIHQRGIFENGKHSESGDEERKTVKKRSVFFKLTLLFGVPLLIMVALAAGIKEFYPVRKPLHLG